MLQLPDKSDITGLKSARDAVDNANCWYARPEIIEAIHLIAVNVRTWLIANRQRTNRYGDPDSSGPWFPVGAMERTDDPDRLDIRRAQFRGLLYGNGLRRMLNLMIVEGLLADYEAIPKFTSFAEHALHDQLVALRLSSTSERALGLEDLKKRFDMAEGYNATKLRNRVIVPMATFGLLKVRIDQENRYQIKLGPVAEIFHLDVFSAVRKHFEPCLTGE